MSQLLWERLHCRPLATGPREAPDTEPWVEGKNDEEWMKLWSRNIQRYAPHGCKCNEHWSRWYPQNQPDYSSRDAYFAWTVKAHNAVNERLHKPIMSVEDAKIIYLAKVGQ